jgi:MFS family permease
MSPAAVERTFYVVSGIYTLAASLIWGVNTLFLLDAGLDIFGVFVANAAFTAGMVIFEIPTGVLADTRGRRFSFLLSVSVLAVGTAGYVAAAETGAGLGVFVAVSLVLGLGFTFYSGAVEAWLVDALAASGFEGNLDRVFSRAGLVTGAAMVVGTTGGGLLGELDLSYPFVGRAVLLMVVLGYAWFRLHDLGFRPRAIGDAGLGAEMGAVAAVSLRYGWRQPSMRLLMAMSFVQTGVISWAWYAWQPYLVELAGSESVSFVGVVAALLALSSMAGNALVMWLSRRCRRRTTLLAWSAAVATGGAIAVGLAPSVWIAVAAFLVIGGALGLTAPVKQAYLHGLVPSEYRASVVSFDSMAGNGGGIGGQLGLGALSRGVSIGAGYVVGGAVLAVLVPLAALLRRRQDAVDVIVGTAGVASACAAQGLPDVLGVDTEALAPAALR